MKYDISILLIILLFIGCTKKTNNNEGNFCASGYALFVYLGENSKPIQSLLIRTNEADSTYKQYIGSSKENLERNGFVISQLQSEEYMDKILLTNDMYVLMKKYIADHNTYRNGNYWTANNNTIKVILSDSCEIEMISYIVDERDIGYFKNLKDTVKAIKNDDLLRMLDYYDRIVGGQR